MNETVYVSSSPVVFVHVCAGALPVVPSPKFHVPEAPASGVPSQVNGEHTAVCGTAKLKSASGQTVTVAVCSSAHPWVSVAVRRMVHVVGCDPAPRLTWGIPVGVVPVAKGDRPEPAAGMKSHEQASANWLACAMEGLSGSQPVNAPSVNDASGCGFTKTCSCPVPTHP